MKIFLYPTAREHSHDKSHDYYNTTPLSREGIKQYCTIVTDPNDADYFYMGQISCGEASSASPDEFQYLNDSKYNKKHIVTIEGDWLGHDIPQWLSNCIYTGNGAKLKYTNMRFCVRPCMSKLLVHLAKNDVNYTINYPEKISFGFCGQLDPHGTRLKLYNILQSSSIENEFIINPGWCGSVDLQNNVIQQYARVLQNNLISLCPRGAGEDTIRFYESCFFGRIPVIVGNCFVMGEDHFDTSFFYRIDPDLASADLLQQLTNISNTNRNELIDKAKLARKYFDEVVRRYYADPTRYFIDFLTRHNL